MLHNVTSLVFVAMESGAEADLAEMLAVTGSHDDGLPLADVEREDEGVDEIGSHEQAASAVGFTYFCI